jgi:hypothetical protein
MGSMDRNFESLWEPIAGIKGEYAISKESLRYVHSKAAIPLNPVFLEIGVCHGRTLAFLSQWAASVSGRAYGIDNFLMVEGSLEGVFVEFESRKLTNWIVIASDTQTAHWRLPIDLLIVDGGHAEEVVSRDIEKYLPFVKFGGYVFFHDYDDPYTRDSCHWAIRYYADQACKKWEDLGARVEGLKGWRKP